MCDISYSIVQEVAYGLLIWYQ